MSSRITPTVEFTIKEGNISSSDTTSGVKLHSQVCACLMRTLPSVEFLFPV